MDTDMEQQDLEKEIDLITHHEKVDPLDSPDSEAEHVPIDGGDTEILRDQPEEEMHNILFNESQNRVVQFHRVSTLDDHKYPA